MVMWTKIQVHIFKYNGLEKKYNWLSSFGSIFTGLLPTVKRLTSFKVYTN